MINILSIISLLLGISHGFIPYTSPDLPAPAPETMEQEIVVKMDETSFITTPITPSSGACYSGDIFLERNDKITTIFESRESDKGVLFPYCSPKIEKLDEDTAEITICYNHGGGSGECSAAVFEFNIEKKSWKYIKNIYFGADFEVHHTEEVDKLLQYMKEKKYNIE